MRVLRFGMHIMRVPTKDNIADDPSREDYKLMRALGARWCEPVLAKSFWHPASWEAIEL